MTYEKNDSPNKGISNMEIDFKLIVLMKRFNTIEINQFVCETRLNQHSCIDSDYIALTFTYYMT